ncbi:MAG: TolC family protein, partial [Pseudomonadota bacterium]
MMHDKLLRATCLATLLSGFLAPSAVMAAAGQEETADSGGDGRSVLASEYQPQEEGTGQTLEDFFTSALDFSPRLRIAEDRLDIGRARRRGANGQLLPQVSATASVNENRQQTETTEGVNQYLGERYALRLQQVLFDWQTFARRGRAYAEENQYEAEYFAELSLLLTDVAERYFTVLEARDTLESVEAELRAVRNQREQVQRMRNLEMVPSTDLYDVEAREASLEAEQLNAEGELNVAREALRSATGLEVGTLFELGESADLSVPEGTPQSWASIAENANHQLEARQYALEAADRTVSERRGAYMPRVSLIATQQRSTLGYDNRPNPLTDTGYVGVDITVPLFAGGSNRAAVNEAQSQRNIASNECQLPDQPVGIRGV